MHGPDRDVRWQPAPERGPPLQHACVGEGHTQPDVAQSYQPTLGASTGDRGRALGWSRLHSAGAPAEQAVRDDLQASYHDS